MILKFDVLINNFDEVFSIGDAHSFEHALQDHLESFEIPILVNNSVDNVGSKDLLGFTGKKEEQVMHAVHSPIITFASVQILGKQLFTKVVDSGCEFLSKLSVFSSIKHAKFNLVHHGSTHGHDQRFAKFR